MNKFWSWVVVGMVIGTVSLFSADKVPGGQPSSTPSSSETSVEDLWPTESAQATREFWADGVTATDVTETIDQNCNSDMCVFIKLDAKKTCSSITLEGSSYDAEDNYIDSFEEDFDKMAAGKTRIVEFGTDALDDTEEYVELDDATCWK